jgi:hypothetical protein
MLRLLWPDPGRSRPLSAITLLEAKEKLGVLDSGLFKISKIVWEVEHLSFMMCVGSHSKARGAAFTKSAYLFPACHTGRREGVNLLKTLSRKFQ